MAEISGTSRLLAQAAPTEERAATLRPSRQGGSFRVFTYVVLTLAAIIYITPFVWMTSKSLMNTFEANSASIIPTSFHFENYVSVLADAGFAQFFWNSVRIAFLAITGQTLIAVLAAYAFARMEFPGRDLVFGVFLLTIFVPETVLLVPNLVTVTRLNDAFAPLHFPWVNNWPALVIPYLSSTFSIFLLRQFFRQIPDDLWDAAQIDGAGHLRFLFQVVIPISRASVLTVILFSFVGTWNALQWPILVTTDNTWRPIAVALQQYRTVEAGNDTNLLMAASVVALLPVLVLYFFTQKHFTRGIATSGMKG